MMNRKERLMATLNGQSVDRPPVSFYELNGLDEKTSDPDPFNIYNDPSWQPLIKLARDKTDRIVMRSLVFSQTAPDPLDELTTVETFMKEGSLVTVKTVKAGKRILVSRTRRDPDVNTIWNEEPLLKDTDDLKAFLEIPVVETASIPDITHIIETEAILGNSGIVMIDTPDPLCMAASLFSMETYLVTALTEHSLFHKLLERFADVLCPRIQASARALSGRLWRIYGSEYAAAPYLPQRLFQEYAVQYEKRMVEVIQQFGGFARIHCHGKIKDILGDIVSMNCSGLDPIEPPPQGDVELGYVREKYGKQLVLFGNLELRDIEILPTEKFGEKVKRALEEGTSGEGRGFVLMPSACPYGRNLPALTLKNYEKMVEVIERF
jgi:uroporphyrinogen-III decarboxylase